MSERRPVGAVDTMWLNMDRPNNLMVIDGVFWFDDLIDFQLLGPLVQHRFLDKYPVFSQRPVGPTIPFGQAHWEDDPDFDLSRHLLQATLPAPGDEPALQRYVESQMSVPFDHDHPMWQMTLIDGYGSAGCALLVRFHHSLADGIALAQVVLSLTNATDTLDPGAVEAPEPFVRQPGGLMGAARSLLDTGAQTVRGGIHAVSQLPELAIPSTAKDVLELGWKTGKIADKILLGQSPPSLFSGEPGIEKRAVWSGPRQVTDVRRVARITGATINDVLLAAVSGAINTYTRDHGAEPVDVTTMVPVNVRPLNQPLPRELGNKFALVYLNLPTGVTQPLQRVAECKRRMDAIKVSPEKLITFGLNRLIGHIEPHVANSITNFFSDKTIGVTTNVVGPQTERFLAGAPIAGIVSWVPGSGRQTLGVCIFSFAGIVRIGFKVDATTIPDPEKLVHAFDEDMDELLRIAARAG